jgi:hypothetical protein
MTRNRILGVLGVLLGGAILLSRVLGWPAASGDGAYGAGQAAGLGFGILLLIVGAYFLARRPFPK